MSEPKVENPIAANEATKLSADEERKIQEKLEDDKLREKEIKFSIRKKLIWLFVIIILMISLSLTFIATSNQETSLISEKRKQGEIILKGLSAAVKSKLLDIFAQNKKNIQSLKTKEEYTEFYQEHEFSLSIFEDIDEVKKQFQYLGDSDTEVDEDGFIQPELVYAYVLGKQGIVLGHTDTAVVAYSDYQFKFGAESYFDIYGKLSKENGALKPNVLSKQIKYILNYKAKGGRMKKTPLEVIDFTFILTFKPNPTIEDAAGELHVGINLYNVNRQIENTRYKLQLVAFGAIVIGLGIAFFFAELLSSPIRRVIDGMELVSQGDFSASVLVKSNDEIGRLSNVFNVMLKGMSVLVSPEVAQVVLSGKDLSQSGERKIVTVLFSDIRAFTTISEALTPTEVVHMLNDYMELMTDTILKFGGVVDKFVGDEIFAVYGTPFEHSLHPLCACATAVDMGVELARHNEEREDLGKPPIRIGIGVNTGEVISGAMGSSKRIDYTSIGDAVNLGARLEGTNKVYGTLIIISEFTYDIVKEDIVARELDLIRVKGKHEPVRIYEVLDLTEKGRTTVDGWLAEKAAALAARQARTQKISFWKKLINKSKKKAKPDTDEKEITIESVETTKAEEPLT